MSTKVHPEVENLRTEKERLKEENEQLKAQLAIMDRSLSRVGVTISTRTAENEQLREQARLEIAAIFNGKIPSVDNPIFDAIEMTQWVIRKENQVCADLRAKLEKTKKLLRKYQQHLWWDSDIIALLVELEGKDA